MHIRTSGQERRSSARRGWVIRTMSVMCRKRSCKRVCETTGGLRPPLLFRGANVCRRKSDFCDAHTRIRSAAAGVSPPWCGKHVCVDTSAIVRRTADGVCAGRRCIRGNSYHGGLTPPALVSRCGRLPAKSDFCDAHTHIRSRAAGVSPPWFVIPTLHRKIEHRSATDERTFTGAAGVSPPWCGKHVCADTSAIVRRTADGVCAGRRCIRGNSYHGGLTPPALVLQFERLPAKKRFMRCTYAHPIRSGGRKPAVG
jgi:hypothetical protein